MYLAIRFKYSNIEIFGIEDELKRQGIKEGDLVKILNWTFEWYE